MRIISLLLKDFKKKLESDIISSYYLLWFFVCSTQENLYEEKLYYWNTWCGVSSTIGSTCLNSLNAIRTEVPFGVMQ